MNRTALVFSILCAASAACAAETRTAPATKPATAPADLGKQIELFTGAHTRFVWVHQLRDDATKEKGLLMGLDSHDAQGERAILKNSKGEFFSGSPRLTPDGGRIVFSSKQKQNDKESKTYVVDWDGSNLREIGPGAIVDVITDPSGKGIWAYLATTADGKSAAICRRLLDQDSKAETVWNKTPVDWSFLLSADLTHAAALLPWPNAGLIDLQSGAWEKYGQGCWVGMAPDNSYVCWVFDGPHRNVYLRVGDDPKDGIRKIDIHQASGIDDNEVYHPRWSNHVRFITMTGPYKAGGDRRGPAVELYLGRFNEGFTAIESWLRITHNDLYDGEGDAWIEGGEKSSIPAAALPPKPAAVRALQVKPQKAWPGDTTDLVFLWESSASTNQIAGAASKPSRNCQVQARDKARFGRFGQMLLAGGSCVAQDCDKVLLDACRKNNQLTVEAVITPDNITQGGPTRIISFSSDPHSRNFTLGQEKDEIVFRLRTPMTGENGTEPTTSVCKVEPGKTYHVIVTYWPGHIQCFVNGRKVVDSTAVKGDFRNWSDHHLLFGDEFAGQRNWAGSLEGVAIYSRIVSPEEAKMKFDLYDAKLKARKPAQRAIVQAKLLEKSPAPDLKSMGTYRRCLVMYAYEIEKVIEGKLDDRKIVVAHWAILDLKAQDEVIKKEIGGVSRLVLEPMADHPQLKGERRMEETSEPDLPAYYDATIGQ